MRAVPVSGGGGFVLLIRLPGCLAPANVGNRAYLCLS